MNARSWRWLCGLVLTFALFGPLPMRVSGQAGASVAGSTKAPVTGLPQWQHDGTPIVTADGIQLAPQIVSDGAGGGIVVWQDFRPYYVDTVPRSLYAQRVLAAGQIAWQTDGIPIASLDNTDPQVASDGQGGAVVVWYDARDNAGRILAQRISADGEFLWTQGGLTIATGKELGTPRLVSDGNGGGFVTWIDSGTDSAPVMAAQHVLANGSFGWGVGGVEVATTGQGALSASPAAISDGMDGLIVAWRGYCAPGWEGLCLQRIQPDGKPAWSDNGVIISASSQSTPQTQLLADGRGGAFAVWVDRRNLNDDIYAQRISANGAPLWASGAPVIAAEGDQTLPQIISDDSDGGLIAWHDQSAAEKGLFLQRIDEKGDAVWKQALMITDESSTAQPPAASALQGSQPYYNMVSDGATGALVAWWGYAQTSDGSRGGIWMQRVTASGVKASGVKAWPEQGAIVQWDRQNLGLGQPDLISEGIGGAIVVWEDNRRWYKVDEYDIYAQRIVEGSYRRFLSSVSR